MDMLLEMLKPPMNTLSFRAMGIVTRILEDMKVEEPTGRDQHPGAQKRQRDSSPLDGQGEMTQDAVPQTVKDEEDKTEERAKEANLDHGKGMLRITLAAKLSVVANFRRDGKEDQGQAAQQSTSSSSSSSPTSGQMEVKKEQNKEVIEVDDTERARSRMSLARSGQS